ncbi:MAG: hypothetical protein U9N34_03075, partial [Candidatus Cloacimonadota bacterium]|nr:hypothetical protein [Candidatus Cloacimonadota bacterium]
QGINWSIEDANIFRKQLALLSQEYLKDTFLKPINLLGRMLFGIKKDLSYQEKYCGTGTSMIAYDIDGRTYPCHMFSPVVLGCERALELKFSGIKSSRYFNDTFCDNCNLKHWCPTCYGFNYRFRNDLFVRDHHWCKMIRIQAIASCEFQLAYYDKHIDELSSQDMTQLKAALKAYHQLIGDHMETDSKNTTERG